jgi:hypothetical protein
VAAPQPGMLTAAHPIKPGAARGPLPGHPSPRVDHQRCIRGLAGSRTPNRVLARRPRFRHRPLRNNRALRVHSGLTKRHPIRVSTGQMPLDLTFPEGLDPPPSRSVDPARLRG